MFNEDTKATLSRRSLPGIAFHPTEPLLAIVARGGNRLRILKVNKTG